MYQYNLDDYTKRKAKITKPIKLIELFGGYGSQALALEKIGADFKSHHLCEWEPEAVRSYHVIHYPNDTKDYSESLTKEEVCSYLEKTGISFDGKTPATIDMLMRRNETKLREYYNSYIVTHNLGSIISTKGTDLEITEPEKYTYMLTYSWPCFVSNSLVLTKKGYKKINEVKVGDYVLTHTGIYRKVLNTYINGIKPTCRIVGNFGEVRCTYNHRFFVRTMVDGKLDKAVWKEAAILTRNDFLALPIPKKEVVPKWGGLSSYIKENKYEVKDNLSEIIKTENFWYLMGAYVANGDNDIFCKIKCDKQKMTALEERISGMIDYQIKGDCIYIDSLEFNIFLKEYNSDIKNINNTIINLPIPLLKAFLEGILQKNNKHNKYYKFKSDNKSFIYALGMCILKVYKKAFQITEQKDGYYLVYKGNKSSNMFCDDDYCYCKFKELIPSEPDTVYDIEVDKDHSLTVQNMIVHNCQSLSVAGKMDGMKEGSGTASSMLWEVKRLLSELHDNNKPLPQILFAENVKQVLSKKNSNKEELEKWINFLNNLGYTSYYKVLNAKDYGVPQNRERFFMFSFLGDYMYHFPEPEELKVCAKDILESNVDEKYFIKTEKAEKLINELIEREVLEDTKTNHIVKVGNLNTKFQQTGRVYGEFGIMPTLSTCSGGGQVPKILQSSCIGAIRNRNALNPNKHKDMSILKPRIELNKHNVSNTITTVQKDNIVLHCN